MKNRDHSGCVKSFHRFDKAYYSHVVDNPIKLNIGLYHDDGSTSGEFAIEWEHIDRLTPRLKAFNDSWSALKICSDLLDVLSEIDSEDLTIDEVVDILIKLGYKDITSYIEKK